VNELDRLKLRQELINVFSAYVKNPTDVEMKKAARKLHQEYGNTMPNVDRNMSLAIRLLPNIGWETIAPKPETDDIERLVFSLATRKA
jgi:hypothetical protein